MSYTVKARFYTAPDNFGEAYVIVSDNADTDTRIEVGKKIVIRELESEPKAPADGERKTRSRTLQEDKAVNEFFNKKCRTIPKWGKNMLKAICLKCSKVYFGWALQEEEHQYCECGERLVVKEREDD